MGTARSPGSRSLQKAQEKQHHFQGHVEVETQNIPCTAARSASPPQCATLKPEELPEVAPFFFSAFVWEHCHETTVELEHLHVQANVEGLPRDQHQDQADSAAPQWG